jgi:hypothetical protein
LLLGKQESGFNRFDTGPANRETVETVSEASPGRATPRFSAVLMRVAEGTSSPLKRSAAEPQPNCLALALLKKRGECDRTVFCGLHKKFCRKMHDFRERPLI